MEDDRDWDSRPFGFINAWTKNPSFLQSVKQNWENPTLEGWAGFILKKKLQSLKLCLKVWNKEVFGNIIEKLKEKEAELHSWDLIAEERQLHVDDSDQRKELLGEVWKLRILEERLRLQKSWLSWALKGDQNTRFFRITTTSRQNRNSLDPLKVNGVSVMQPGEGKQVVVNHFKNLYAERWKIRPKLGGQFKSINTLTNESAMLESVFTKDEVWAAIKDCDGNKAPGLDGFNVFCLQKCWKVMKHDIMKFMFEFHENEILAGGFNCSFISLIPKKENPLSLSDFRLISLISSVYKILSKVLSRRLKLVLPSIVSEAQSAFLGGRSILDGVLIANEIIDWWKKSNTQGVIIKLDFEKAFDTGNWEFLFDLFVKFGFGTKWLGWMKSCLTTASISILVNGSPTDEFRPERGLRQGDPLSPVLFNIVAEGLNLLLTKAMDLGLIKGAVVGPTGLRFTHLQFADDTILFCEADLLEITTLKRIFRCFEIMSGLKINFHKSTICGVGVSEALITIFSSTLNCLNQKLPLKYLGLPLAANPRSKATWKPVLDKYKSKLSGWKKRFLSFVGRLTHIKSTLSSLPIFYLYLFKMPKCVIKEVDKVQVSFLWGDLDVKRKVRLVSWKDVSLTKMQGALGVRSLGQVSICLLTKWWWRFCNEKQALWKRLIFSEYSIRTGSWFHSQGTITICSWIWKDIMGLASENPALFNFFLTNSELVIGNGGSISFWKDIWVGTKCLQSKFPRLFSLSSDKDGSLLDFIVRKSSSSNWTLSFRRPSLAWEDESVHNMQVLLGDGPSLRHGMEDRMSWKASSQGVFKAKDLFYWWQSNRVPDLFMPRFIWNNISPPKVQFFYWLVWKGRVKTSVFLHHIGILRGEDVNQCIFCKSDLETINHVLLLGPFSWKIWSAIIDWWGLFWVCPGSVVDLFDWWLGTKFKKKELQIWKVIPLAVVWSIWKLRNDCVVNSAQLNFLEIIELIKVRIAVWLKNHSYGNTNSIQDFVSNLNQIRLCI
ncbi:unnamed protein product [Camellia sinensis]